LPSQLFQFAQQALKNEKALDDFVANTVQSEFDFPWAKDVKMRTVKGDAKPEFSVADDTYGLRSMGEQNDGSGMMNMLDVGGNMGMITIGAFMKFPKRMRIIVVEPMPSTNLLLRWNLHLNGIPELSPIEFYNSPNSPGVLVLNNGIASKDGEEFGMCYTPPQTQNARMCDCSEVQKSGDNKEECHHLTSRNLDALFNMFKQQPLEMLKMDCEGCETALMPSLAKLPQMQISRFAGELHAMSNELEDRASKYDGGKWWVHVCWEDGKYNTYDLIDRLAKGPNRASCVNPDK
jgi:FkbM family methyltransferase